MASFELTLSNGEKIIADHKSASVDEMLAEIECDPFIVVNEAPEPLPVKQIIVATRQLTLVRLNDPHP